MWITALVIVAAGLRVAWAFYASRPPRVGDPLAYIFYGKELARGHGYRSFMAVLAGISGHPLGDQPAPPTAFYPIGFPGALGGLFWMVFHTPWPDSEAGLARAVGLFNACCDVGTVLLVFGVARRLFDNRVGLVAAGIVALFPNLIFMSASAHLETLFNFTLMAAVYVAVSADWSRGELRTRRLLAFGAVLAVSALVRPFSLLFLPVLGAVLWAAGSGWARAARQVAIAALAAVVVLSPWTIRNVRAMRAPVFIATNLGEALCLDRNPDATGAFSDTRRWCRAPYSHLPLRDVEVAQNRGGIRTALRFVVENPATEARLILWRGYYTYRSDHDGLTANESNGSDRFIPPRIRGLLTVVADSWFFAILALALLGLPAFLSRRHPRRLFVALCAAAMAVVPLGLYGHPRFHEPLLPFLAILAAAPLCALFRAGRQRVA